MIDRAITFAFRVVVVIAASAILAALMIWLWTPVYGCEA